MQKSTKIKIWAFFMRYGNRLGCHQREDRSFKIKGWQFPICSRCTGILIGQFLGIIFYLCQIKLSFYLDFIFLFIMFYDWFIQYINIKESTNLRRFITGNLAGIAQISIIAKLLLFIINNKIF
ncbi:MAG: DUF2085 domain-containing protein [Clostridia bacterium]|jgi:uncharacterized membrane protein|nr:DUF2085 domain-containing protein [Clostridia bacterium]